MFIYPKTEEAFNKLFSRYNIMVELGLTATAYEPYHGNTYSVTFPAAAGTVYGGTPNVTKGTLAVTKANIASYAGETLPGAWISDRDVYAAGTTPTIGAQVVYELAEPIVYHLTPVEIRTLAGQNTIWADTGNVSVEYTADTKAYIDKKLQEMLSGTRSASLAMSVAPAVSSENSDDGEEVER